MKAKFWGVRGSIPTPITSADIDKKLGRVIWKARNLNLSDIGDDEPDAEQNKIIREFIDDLDLTFRGTIGGNTPCVQIIPDDERTIIIDCGSGIRGLGNELMSREFGKGTGEAHIFLSHTHWDHICGLPFFIPIFKKGNILNFYGGHDHLEERLANQHNPWHFPVPWKALGSTKRFKQIGPEDSSLIGDTTVKLHELFHPGKSFAYRFENTVGKSIVYASDAEYKHLQHSKIEEYLKFFRNADILIFDTQYTLTEALAKEDWGHSSAMIGIEMAMEAGVKNLVMFHHEPAYDDEKVVNLCKKADKYQELLNDSRLKCNIQIAYEGLELTV